MKTEQNPINGRPRRRPRLPAAAAGAALAFEERVIWPSEDAARSTGGAVRSGLDRGLWELQRRLVWPAQDRVRELDGSGRILAGAALVLVAVATGVAGLLWASSGGSGASSTAGQVAVAAPKTHPRATPAKAAKPQPEPTLHGAAPVFKPLKPSKPAARSSHAARSSAAAEPAAGAGAGASSSSSASAATSKISSSPAASASTSSDPEAASVSGPPAGPAAIAVAREFADAFVVYETGGTEAKVRGAFKATTSGELAHSLLRRPPKQPAAVKVPRAKVVNIVAAPSDGALYPVSVSLLRVGVTSELRLEMERLKDKGWRVTNVLG